MDPAKMKVVDLRSELGALGLDTKGNKPALVERLKKALEAKSGKAIPDTSILDTSTEDADEPATPRRPGPASRTTRRASSSRVAPATPIKETPENVDEPDAVLPAARMTRRRSSLTRLAAATPTKQQKETPEPIAEEPKAEEAREPSPEPAPPTPAPAKEQEPPEPEPEPEPERAAPQPVPAPPPVPVPPPAVPAPQPVPPVSEPPAAADAYSIYDDRSSSPVNFKQEPMEVQKTENIQPKEESEEKMNVDEVSEVKKEDNKEGVKKEVKEEPNENNEDAKNKALKDEARELSEAEEWRQLNERLREREQERREREQRQAEEEKRREQELSQDPVRLQRHKRKQEKKNRWSNFYKSVEVINEVLTPPVETDVIKPKKETSTEVRIPEPELDDDKITLSWYDSDLNQYLELPGLNAVTPLSEGAFAHAWAGARASHGVSTGRVYYEVRVGDKLPTIAEPDKDAPGSGLRVGWSTEDSSLHLGADAQSWALESSGRRVCGGTFEPYGAELSEKDVVGAYLDLESSPCKISFAINGVDQGVAYEFEKEALGDKPLFPHVLTKNISYKVNFGYDKYNMLTKTKTVRKRLEIPVEEVIEQKKAIEAELQKQKEEAERKEKERLEREKKEREERQRKRKEERERQDRERKERENREKRDRGEEVTEDDKDKAADNEPAEASEQPMEGVEDEQPKENGEGVKPEAKAEPTVPEPAKDEPMEAAPADLTAQIDSLDKELSEELKKELTDEEIKEVTEEQILKGQVLLDKRIKFVIRHTVEEELDGPVVEPTEGFVFVAHAALLPGPRRPATLADCEVILMVGMPGAGKTYWVTAHAAANPQKRYNVLSTGALFERMQVDCKPFRASYEGRWDAMVSKCAKCVLKLLEIAKGRRRNYILDQTNVYPSAQRRKLREFDGRRRVAVVVVPDEASHAARRARKDQADGKEVPDGAVLDMKANFALPEVSSWLDEVIYPELGPEEAKAVVEALHKEARAAGVHREREKRDRSPGRDQPPNKRSRDDRRHRDDRRPPRDHSSRDREDRWGGGGGGGRWGPAGGGGRGGRWGSRDRSGPPAPAPARFDRGWGAPARGNDFSRDRDDFRGGRGGPGGPGGRGGPGNRGGPRGDRGPGGPPAGDRFGRPDRNQGRPGGPGMDKRPNAPGGGGGGWQRGNQGPGRGPPRPNQQMALRPNQPNQKDGQGQGQNPNQQNPQWNQWQNQWGNWNNWNQNQAGAWNWGNWGGWNQNANAANNTGGAAAAGGKQAQWAGYTPQQWYQWQQWQQQQGWQGYQQQQQGNQPTTANAAEQAWAQYYQNYGGGNANAANSSSDKK